MPIPACLIQTDLSQLLVTDGRTSQQWTAPQGEELNAGVMISRARDAAKWTLRNELTRKRIRLVCLDVDEILCTWLRSESDNEHVLDASFRNLVSDWGNATAGRSVVPLGTRSGAGSVPGSIPFTRKKPDPTDGPIDGNGAVLSVPDAMARLWLDALDKSGAKVGAVTTLWHAAAIAWCPRQPLRDELACVLLERGPGSFAWAWHRGGDVVAAGTTEARVDPESPSAADALDRTVQRLTLDWLAWSTQLGQVPDRLVIVSPDPAPIEHAIRARRADFVIESVTDESPTLSAVNLAAARIAEDPSLTMLCADSMPSLTRRPSRAVRRRYQLIAASIALLGVALIGMALEFGRVKGDWHSASATVETRTMDEVAALGDPSLTAAGQNVVNMLMVKYTEALQGPSHDPPAPPRPLFRELGMVLSTLQEEEFQDCTLLSVDFSSDGPSFKIDGPDRNTLISLEERLNASDSQARWSRTSSNSRNPNLNVQFRGTWNGDARESAA